MKPKHNITLAFWLNLFFAIIELAGAFVTNSVAIASNAIHDLSDSFAIGLSWYLERYSNKGQDHRFSFGYKRFSLLAALINCLVLILGSVLILREAVPRLFNPEAVSGQGMIYLALFGIVINAYAAFKLHQGHSHNETILSLHFIEDVLGWIAVLIVAFAMKLGPYAFLDPLLSIGIAFFILFNASRRLKTTLLIFLQSIPDDLNIHLIKAQIQKQVGVLDTHDLHVWSLDGKDHILSAHVVIQDQLEHEAIEQIKIQIKQALSLLGLKHMTLEFESNGALCELRTN